MANVTTTSAAYFIPEIWANRALEIMRAKIVMASRILRDSDVASFQQGDTLNIPIPGTFVAKDKAANSAVTLQVPTDGNVDVKLDKHKEVSFLVEDVVRAQQNIDVMDTYMQSGVVAIVEAMEKDLMGLNLGASGITGSIGTALTGASLRAARNVLNKAKCPTEDRYAVVSPDDETSMLGDTNLATYFANAKTEAVSEGAIGRIAGFETIMSQLVPLGANVQLGGATGGTWTVTYNGQTTSNLAYNANAAAVKAAVEALSTVGAGNVEVTAITGGFEIYMKAALAGSHDQITATLTSLTGSTDAECTDVKWNQGWNRGAYMLAMRSLPAPDPNTGARAVALRDPTSGLVVRVLYAYNPTYLGHQCTIDVLYGVKTIRGAKATIIKS
jgi:hypothetical protein